MACRDFDSEYRKVIFILIYNNTCKYVCLDEQISTTWNVQTDCDAQVHGKRRM